ncbi:E2 domain-associated cysteine-rich protein [Rhizobium leguminosarum]
MSPLDQLYSVAHNNHARLVSAADGLAIYAVNPPNASGAPSPDFILEIRRDGKSVTVAEQQPTLLPLFCAERHINPGGTFCLYWGEAEPSEIGDQEAAEVWWGRLLAFLLRQHSAAALRRWPGKADARAHGSTAARFQAMAEQNAAALGPRFLASLREDRLRLAKGRRRDRIALMKDGERLVAVHRGERRVMTLRQRCKCDNANSLRLPLAACGGHARQLADFVLNLDGWQRAEEDFYKLLRTGKHVCCGTMDDCPLAKSAAN